MNKDISKKAVVFTIVLTFLISSLIFAIGEQVLNNKNIDSFGNGDIFKRIKKFIDDISANEVDQNENQINDNQLKNNEQINNLNPNIDEVKDDSDPPILDSDPWWNSDWLYRKRITINHTNVDDDLTDFPVLVVNLDDSDLAIHAQLDGDDIVFVNKSGVKLAHEIEYYDSGDLVCWVNVISLSGSSDTILYMYYGNSSCNSQENIAGTWNSNYVMVQHMNETSGIHYDSTNNDNDASEFISPDSNMDTDGKINGADWFDGDDYLQITGDLVSGDGNTVSFWEYNMTIYSGYGAIFDDWSGSNGFLWQFGDFSTNFQVGNVGDWSNNLVYTHGGLIDDTWHYFVVTMENNHIRIYEDGSLVGYKTHNTNVVADGDNVLIMRRSDGHYSTGKMDELRISDVNRSANWISTCYNNQNDPSDFCDIGAQEMYGVGVGPVVSEPSPGDNAIDVSTSINQLSFKLNDSDGDLMNYTVVTVPNIGSDSGNQVGNNTYTVGVSGLTPFTNYVWHVNVTDGIYWTNETFSFTTEGLSFFDPSLYGWQYQKKITVDNNLVSDTLSDFPLLVDITDADLISQTQNDGSDILFMDGAGSANILNHEIEYYNSGSGHLVVWIKIPILSSSIDTTIYMYYGNSYVSNMENTTGVWVNDYEMVVHLSESSGTVYDSTTNGYTGSKVGGVNQNVAGKIAGADNFNGVDSYLNFGDVCDITSGGATWSYWVKHDSLKTHRYFGKGASGILGQWFRQTVSPFNSYIELGNVADWSNRATYTIPQDSGNWHYVTFVFDNSDSKYKVYLDGSFGVMGSASSLPSDNSDSFVIGSGYTHESYAFTHGTIDEGRVSSTTRNSSWIATCYNNQNNPSSFYSISHEIDAGAPDISNPSPSDGASDVSISLTQLTFNLSDPQGDLMDYSVVTNPDIGTDSGNDVGNNTYSVSVSGLSPFTIYTWYVNASDSNGNWNNVSFTFSTAVAASFDPSLYGWQYQKQIIIDHNIVTDDLNNFPLLISIIDSDLAAHALSDGRDIIFMSDGGNANLLNHEIELFNSTSGELIAWVKIPSLSASIDTEIFMYYGKSDAPLGLENASGIWESNYLMVQHLDETSDTHIDSTGNSYNGNVVGGVNQNAIGKIGNCDYFSGTGYINFGDVLDIVNGGATWSCWLKLDSYGIHRIIGKGSTGLLIQWYNASGSSELQAGYIGPGNANWSNRSYTSKNQDLEWHYLTALFNDSVNKYQIYFDGELVATGTESDLPDDNTDDFVVGSGYTHDYPTTGYIDEARVSDVARSSSWIETCYKNQNEPTSYIRVGSEAAAGAPVISNISPSDEAIDISATITELSFKLTDYQGDSMTYYVETIPDIGSGTATVGNGTYNLPVSGIMYETSYTWYLNVTDGTNWNNETFTFTTRPIILLTNESPPNGNNWAIYNPRLSIDVEHDAGQLITIKFLNNASGAWKEIYTYTNSDNGSYTAKPFNMTSRGKTFYWRVNVSDGLGNYSEETYSFNMVNFVGDVLTKIARSFCCKFGYIGRAREQGRTIVITQQADHPGPYGLPEDIPHFAMYDINQGWIKTYEFVFNSGNAFHPFWGFYGDEYHMFHGQGSNGCMVADSDTWEGFQSMDFHSEWYTTGPRETTNPTPSAYTFDNENAWIISSDTNIGNYVMKYWPWNLTTGWGSPVIIEATRTGSNLDAGQLLQLNKSTWFLYYAIPGSAKIVYVKTNDSGQTWTGPYDPSIPTTTSSCNRMSFAQYGKNYYIFVTEGGGQAVIYNSTDGENWANRQVLFTGHIVHHGTLLHQSVLISTHSGTGDPSDQYGIITTIPEMISDPGKPNNEYPPHETIFDLGTTSTSLKVMVHGGQMYDVAFYWENGTYIGEDKLLEEGDIARVNVNGLVDNNVYKWYAVCRGATGKYDGSEPLSTSDENVTNIFKFSVGIIDAPIITNENPNDGSLNIPITTSELSFDLSDYQGDLMTYYVTTTPDIGSDSATVVNGTYSITISNLDYATLYTWNVNVTDGVYWTNKTFSFSTELETTFYPFTQGWLYRKKIIIDHNKVAEDLTNFPMLINITDSDLSLKAQSNGYDILFMDDKYVANRLNHEI